jgi:hypothetical protein
MSDSLHGATRPYPAYHELASSHKVLCVRMRLRGRALGRGRAMKTVYCRAKGTLSVFRCDCAAGLWPRNLREETIHGSSKIPNAWRTETALSGVPPTLGLHTPQILSPVRTLIHPLPSSSLSRGIESVCSGSWFQTCWRLASSIAVSAERKEAVFVASCVTHSARKGLGVEWNGREMRGGAMSNGEVSAVCHADPRRC